MKQYRLLLLPLIALASLFSSCSEDFKVDAPYKNITVVYGLLNADSTRNYIRIQKAFLDENKSAIDMAMVPDSSYYTSLVVHMKELNSSGSILSDETLQRVDLAAEGLPKDSGSFFNAPNYAYKSTHSLNVNSRYLLIVHNTVTGETDSAITVLVNTSPGEFSVNGWNTPDYTISFSNQTPTAHPMFKLVVRTPQNGASFEGIIRFHYVDKNILTGVQTDKSFDWRFAQGYNPAGTSGTRVDLMVEEGSFYPVIFEGMGLPPANVQRYMDSVDLFVWSGSPELYTYQQISGSQGGITGDQVKPIYTNIKGQGALGLFASRGVVSKYNVGIAGPTLDSLMNNYIVRSLQIKGRSDH